MEEHIHNITTGVSTRALAPKGVKCFSTYELVKELEGREGVEVRKARAYETLELFTDGPSIVLLITD